jgi:parallel beta-helix repeat protein
MREGPSTRRQARRRWRKAGGYALALTTLFVLVAAPIQTAGAATRVSLWVDQAGTDAGNNCRVKTNPCETITRALAVAPTTGTNINLLSDVDDEVNVTKDNVTIQSSPTTSHFDIRPTTDTLTTTTPAGAAVAPIVTVGTGRTGIKLTNVTIDGSTRPAAAGCSSGLGHTGLYVKGAQVTLTKTSVSHITQGLGLEGCQNGSAVRADAGSNFSINGGAISDYDKNGFTCNGADTTCVVNKTVITGRGPVGVGKAAQNGIQISRGAIAIVAAVKVSGHNYTPNPQATGILIYNAGSGVTIKNSDVFDNDSNIYAYRDGASGPGSQGDALTVTTNKVHSGPSQYGIVVDSLSGATVTRNKVWDNSVVGVGLFSVANSTIGSNVVGVGAGGSNGEGVYVGGDGTFNAAVPSTGNTVQGNKVNGNDGDGIHADVLTSGNTFQNNYANGNGGFGAHDQSTGAGTAGTANTWTGNRCTGGDDNPNGLCS